jgi:catechol 2,3-dioxygenase-like lactoylglutathione lyase family enzyme
MMENGEDNCFLGSGDGFFLTLFKGEHPGLNHYCYAIKEYDVEKAEEKLKAAGLKPRREGDRIYFPDPDGITVQVAGK